MAEKKLAAILGIHCRQQRFIRERSAHVCALSTSHDFEDIRIAANFFCYSRRATIWAAALIEVLTVAQIQREFDPYDIAANVSGSLIAIALCNWYHKRMIERKRAARGYNAVAGDDELDVELGEGVSGQETGVVRSTVDDELDRWDENEEDWETTDPDPVIGNGVNAATVVAVPEDLEDGKKRSD